MFHSIIIPHRDRNRELDLTLWCLWHRARQSGCEDYEVVVVDGGSKEPPKIGEAWHRKVKWLRLPLEFFFNKPRLLNAGIENSTGDFLTFLDADMLAGEEWFDGVTRCAAVSETAPKRLCYRVRQLIIDPLRLNVSLLKAWEASADKPALLDDWFCRFNHYTIAFEGYGCPEVRHPSCGAHRVWGNSQWSIGRQTLGNVRFDESYEASGFEDMAILLDLWERLGAGYSADILTDANHGLLHVFHDRSRVPGDPWSDPVKNRLNRSRYKARKREVMVALGMDRLPQCESCGVR